MLELEEESIMILRNVTVNQSVHRNIPEDSRGGCENLISQETFSIQTLKNGEHFNTSEDSSVYVSFSVYVSLKLNIFIHKTFLYCSRTGIQQFIKNPSDRL